MPTETAVSVAAVCPSCQETRYLSIRPIGLKETLSAKLFNPVNDAPPLTEGEPALCHMCGSALRFMKSIGTADPREAPTRTEMMAQRAEASKTEAKTEVLFEARQGEEVKEIRETSEGAVVITNKRIVRVAF